MTGDELKTKRAELNMTQAALADKLSVSGNTVARWERNEVAIPPYLILALKQIKAEINQKPNKKKDS